MKSKKGFTLIEILAIIVILAIIAVITVPIVLEVIDNSKIGAIKNSAYGYINSVNKLYVSKSVSDPDFDIPDNYYVVSALKTMGVSVSGDEPRGNSWVRVIDNEVIRGCLQFGEYSVNITNGVVGNVIKGECYASDPVSFETDSWEMIKAAVNEDNTDVYSVGDTKEVEIDGVSYTVRIANKSTSAYCSEKKYSQTACGFVVEFVDLIGNLRGMNSSDTNVGGWPASEVFSYLNTGENSVYSKLPSDLKNVIADTYTVTGHGLTEGETNSEVTSKLYLFSPYEIGEWNTKEISTWPPEDNIKFSLFTRKLDYYLNVDSDLLKNKTDINGEIQHWWLRTPSSDSVDGFFFFYKSFGGSYVNATFNLAGVAPAFRIVKD